MNRLLTTAVIGLAGMQGVAMAATDSRPKLVVGIMVDQLRTDYLENLKDLLSEGGFRRLMETGVYLKDVDFHNPEGDAASASAIIQTGSYPRFTGITGEKVYDPSIKALVPVFQDPAYIGNFTEETYSPAALRVTTISDEVDIENKGKGKIHSIAPEAAQAIVLAGHNATSAFWINDESGRWSSTTYYSNPPASIQNRNYNSPLISRLDTMKWTPLHKGEPYPDVSSQEIKDGFKFNFPRSDRDVFLLYKKSPYLNSDISEVASEYVSGLNIGKNPESIDILNIGYSLAPYPATDIENYKYPLQDSYLRLDKDLENLFTTLDKYVGKDNFLVYLVSTGYFTEPTADALKYRLPGGTFSVKRSMSLLNAYLSAKYGNGAYIDQYTGNHIYLNKGLIEEKGLELKKVSEDARDFFVKMSGVADAYTENDLMSPALAQLEKHRLSVDPKTSGDIIVEFNPGWTIVDDTTYPSRIQENKNTAYLFPAFIMGSGISEDVIETTVDATSIAPTIANILRIRAPNSVVAKPLNIKERKD